MLLNYQVRGEGYPMIILHGLFGSLDNWRTLALHLSEKFKVFTVDLRNHGKSFHHHEHNYDVMSNDLYKLCHHIGIDRCILLGHSMGGKVAMKFACNYQNFVKQLVVVDISPKSYIQNHDQVLEALNSVDFSTIASRSDVDQALSTYIDEQPIRQFLMKGLQRLDNNRFSWKFNLNTITNNYNNISVGLNSSDHFDGNTLFMSGSKSNYIKSSEYDIIYTHFPNAVIESVEAGHWIHAENPKGFLESLQNNLV